MFSHGKSGGGAYTSAGAALPCGTGLDAENCDGDDTFLFEEGQAHGTSSYDDTLIFSLAQLEDEGWWSATDSTGLDVTNINLRNVGIGSERPESKLHVAGTNADPAAITIDSNGDSDAASLYNLASDGLVLSSQSQSANQHDVFIAENGHVGIGTTTPEQRLSVNGDVGVTGNIGSTGTMSANISQANRMNSNLYCNISNTHCLDVRQACPNGQYIQGFQANGQPICVTDRVRPQVTGACPAGQQVQGFSNGQPYCGADAPRIPNCPSGHAPISNGGGGFSCGAVVFGEYVYNQRVRNKDPHDFCRERGHYFGFGTLQYRTYQGDRDEEGNREPQTLPDGYQPIRCYGRR